MNCWYKEAWDLHLAGFTTAEISAKLNKQVRVVQTAIKTCREKYPATTEERAMKDYVKRLDKSGKCGSKCIRSRVRKVFGKTLTPSVIAAMCGKAPPKAAKKAAKKVTKCTAKQLAKKQIKKKFPRAKPLTKSVVVATLAKKKIVKKAVKRLDKKLRPCCTKKGVQLVPRSITVPDEVFVQMIKQLINLGMPSPVATDFVIRCRNVIQKLTV